MPHPLINKRKPAMTSSRLLSFDELLREVPEEKRHLLDKKVKYIHLENIAKKLLEWREVLPYLLESDAEEEEETIAEDFKTTKRRRLVRSGLK